MYLSSGQGTETPTLSFFFSETRSPETHLIYMHDFGEVLNVNLENIPKNLQREIIDKLGPFLTPETDGLERTHVRFNYLAEEIYIKNLFMSFRKMGYDCVFSRYNNDRGLASFTRSHVDSDSVKPTYSYYKSGLPNNCWWYTIESQREKTHLLTYAPNEDSNQPAHPCSLIRIFVVSMTKLHLWLSQMRSVKILIRLRECAVWSESSLGAHTEGTFSVASRFLCHWAIWSC